MKRLWKEISEAIVKMNKNFVVRTTYVMVGIIGSILFMCCTRKDKDVGPTLTQSEIAHGNEGCDTVEGKEASTYRPSGFHYDKFLKTVNAEDEYNDRLDDYLDDPEDELRFDPEIFDFQDE